MLLHQIDGTGEHARILNEMAEKGWRLVATTTFTRGTHRARVYFYLGREKPEK